MLRTISLIVAKRLLGTIPTVIGLTFIVFVILNSLPGGIAGAILGPNASPSLVHIIDLRLGLNHPFFMRYFHWLRLAATGNFGMTVVSSASGNGGGIPVSSIIAQRLPVTAEISGTAFVIALCLSFPMSILASRRPRGVVNRLSVLISTCGFACPQFVFALILILVFAVHFRFMPVFGYVPISSGIWGNLHHIVLPSSALAFGLFCAYVRILRADIIDQMNREAYIDTARAKGLAPNRILIRHAARNSLSGLITVAMLNVGTLLGGAVIIEQVFGLPGMGSELLQAINLRDVTVVQAIVCILGVTVVLANLLADILYAVLDPRVRYARRSV